MHANASILTNANTSKLPTGGALFFVESRNEKSLAHATGRIPLKTLLARDAFLVALDLVSGERAWEIPLELPGCRNVLYLSTTGDRLPEDYR